MPGKSHASSDKAKVLADSIQVNTKVLIRYIASLSGQRIPAEVVEESLAKLRKMLYNIPAVYNHTWPFQQASLATKAQKIESQDIFSAVAMAQNDILNDIHAMVPLSPEAIYFSKIDSVVRFLEIGEQRPRKGWEYAMNKGYLCNLTLKNFLINFGLEMDVLHRDFPHFEWSRYDGYGKSRETRKWHHMCKALADHIMCNYLLMAGHNSESDLAMKSRGAKRGRLGGGGPTEFVATTSSANFATQSVTPSENYFYVDRDEDTDMRLPNPKRSRAGYVGKKMFGSVPPPVNAEPVWRSDAPLFQHQFALNASPQNHQFRAIGGTQLPSGFVGTTSLPGFGVSKFDVGAGMMGGRGNNGSNNHPPRVPYPLLARPNLAQVRLVADQPPPIHSAAPSVISDGSANSTASMQYVEPRRTMPTHASSFPFYPGDDPFPSNDSVASAANVYAGGSQSVGNAASTPQTTYGTALPSIPSSAGSFPSTPHSMPISCSSAEMPLLAEAVTAPNLKSSFSTPNFSLNDMGMLPAVAQHAGIAIPQYNFSRTPTSGTPSASNGAQSAPNMSGWSSGQVDVPPPTANGPPGVGDWTSQTIRQFELMQAAAKQLQQIQESFQNLAAQAALNVEQQTQANSQSGYMDNQGGPSQHVPQPSDFTSLTFDNSQFFNNPMDVDHGMDVDARYN